ncbi:M18 family aminopeptidase [Myxococcota bacterium]|nr:M18 family aminopeptidase [Myxococcota bacterium]
MADEVADLLSFIDRSPTPFHAVEQARLRLEDDGFQELLESELWSLEPGDRRYLVRGGGSLVAFHVGTETPAQGGFRIVGAHTDSPNLRVKPVADLRRHGYIQFGVETYGGVLLHTWLDRDLSLAGRVTVRSDSGPRQLLLDFGRPLLRIPNLAIHLQRELQREGLKLDPQVHSLPVSGLEATLNLAELVAGEMRAQGLAEIEPTDILAYELMTYDVQPACVGGAQGEFVFAPRLDNLASCHAALRALGKAGQRPETPCTRVVVLYDHEEVGSRSASGASSTLLADGLERIISGYKGGEPQGLPRAVARSLLVSADMAHAVHPNYADRHDPSHRPVLGGGPVIKVNANQSYASDSETAGTFRAVCSEVGVEVQHFVSRNDLPCGSTIGPISAARLGIPTVDVGNPMLSMHSCREMAGSLDVEPMIAVMSHWFASP